MAQFRAVIRGQRGEASRLGGRNTGIVANVNGWNGGVRVEAVHRGGADFFNVYATGGSNRGTSEKLLGCVDGVGGWHPACPKCESFDHVVCHEG